MRRSIELVERKLCPTRILVVKRQRRFSTVLDNGINLTVRGGLFCHKLCLALTGLAFDGGVADAGCALAICRLLL